MESKMVYYATEIEKKNQELQHSLEYYEGRLSCNVRYITFYKSDLDPLKAQLETLHTLCKELLTTLYNFDVGNSYLRGKYEQMYKMLHLCHNDYAQNKREDAVKAISNCLEHCSI